MQSPSTGPRPAQPDAQASARTGGLQRLQAFAGRSLAVRLVGAIALLLVVSLATVTTVEATSSRSRLITQIQEDFEVRAVNVGQEVGLLLEGYVKEQQVLSLNATLLDAVRARNASYTGTPQAILGQVEALDARWRAGDAALIGSVLSTDAELNPAATSTAVLQDFAQALPSNVETFITDRYGGTVASNNELSDYYQADEGWWQAAWNGGNGALYISEPELDESTNTVSLQVALPLVSRNAQGTRELIGVLRTTVDAKELFALVQTQQFGATGHLELFNANATQVLGASVAENMGTTELTETTLAQLIQAGRGATISPDAQGNDVAVGFAPVNLKEGVPNWTLLVRQDASEALAPVRATIVNGIVATLVALALAVGVAVLLARSLTQPIEELVGVAERVGRGDLSHLAEVKTQDEIGMLAKTFNRTIVELREANKRQEEELERSRRLQSNIGSFLDVAMDIGGGDLTKRGVVTEDALGNVVDAINVMIDEFGVLLRSAQETAASVAAGSDQMVASSDAISSSAQLQADEALRAQSEVQSVVASIQQTAQRARDAATTALDTLQSAEAGKKALDDTLLGMQSIRTQVAKVATRATLLGQSSQEISEITDAISDFASQTNLLALSAALEAAGAGESGRRFAVVAEEVGLLAERSAEAAERITQLVTGIQKEVGGVVAEVEAGVRDVEKGYEVAAVAGRRLGDIATVSRQSALVAEAISESTRAQVTGVEQVGKVVTQMAELSAESQSTVLEGREVATRLRRFAEQLTQNLVQFRVG